MPNKRMSVAGRHQTGHKMGTASFQRIPGLAFRRLDDQTVIVMPRNRQVHVLNLTGSLIWELLESQRSLEQLVRELERDGEFEAEPGQVARDVEVFVGRLEQGGLVVRGPAVTSES
jgi:hypothetical protein